AHLDAQHVVTAHSVDGMDEISLSAETHVFEYRSQPHDGATPKSPVPARIRPEDYGLGRVPVEALHGGSAADNAAILRRILAGERGPHRDVVVLNAAYALLTSGRFDGLDACLEAAQVSIDSGAARERLERLVAASHAAPAPES